MNQDSIKQQPNFILSKQKKGKISQVVTPKWANIS